MPSVTVPALITVSHFLLVAEGKNHFFTKK
jgi:hypothetical protein